MKLWEFDMISSNRENPLFFQTLRYHLLACYQITKRVFHDHQVLIIKTLPPEQF